jgi:hypothetical protein
MSAFSEINFKYTDAEEEKLYAPELIQSAYVDIDSVLNRIDAPEKYLVVGPKGAGKTALSSKLSILEHSQWDLFVDSDILEQFEYQLLKKTGGDKSSAMGGALTAWQLILILRLIPLFLRDEHFKKQNDFIEDFNAKLKSFGLTESKSLLSIAQYTSRTGIISKINSALASLSSELSEEKNYKIKDSAALLDTVKNTFKKITPLSARYYLIIDGIDYVFREGRSNSAYISDLINAVRQLNLFMREINLFAKVIILIRDEVLQIVPDPNLTKRINDNGVQLRWYDNVRSPFETSLLEVIEKRARLAGFDDTIKNLWYRWFPKEIHHSNSLEFVMRNTRYLPRDLISFFREIQALDKEPPFNTIDVLSALNNYSDWFLQELRDALVGLLDENVRNLLPNIITDLGREFHIDLLREKLDEYAVLTCNSAEDVARKLFNASWIGNKWNTNVGTPRYAWRHRKINAQLNLKHHLVVHSGLWKTLNLI